MIVINACIYNSTDLGNVETEKLNEGLKLLKIKRFTNVFTVPTFLAELEANKDEEVLLFSNFPPNDLYLKNGVSPSVFERFENNVPDWTITQYKASAGLFSHICMEYKFMAIHFITGAPIAYMSDTYFRSLTNQIPTTIKRKHDWAKEGINYEVMLRLYLMQKIKEAIEESC